MHHHIIIFIASIVSLLQAVRLAVIMALLNAWLMQGHAFPIWPTGHRHSAGLGVTVQAASPQTQMACLALLCTKVLISSLMLRGTEDSPWLCSHFNVRLSRHLWLSSRHIMPSSSSQYFGKSETSRKGFLEYSNCMHKRCNSVSCE